MDHQDDFNAGLFDRKNPVVMRHFIRFAMEARNAGAIHYGAKAIWERMRWELNITKRGEYKLDNNYVAWYAREAMRRRKSLRGFFWTRGLK